MGDLADSLNDPDVLRLENLDTDLRPPQAHSNAPNVQSMTTMPTAIFPFSVSMSCDKLPPIWSGSNPPSNMNWKTECIISAGSLSGILNVFAGDAWNLAMRS